MMINEIINFENYIEEMNYYLCNDNYGCEHTYRFVILIGLH